MNDATTRPAHSPARMVFVAACVALLVAVWLAVTNGTLEVPAQSVVDAVWRGLRGETLTGDAAIVWNLRLPRVAMAVLVGSSLALAGAAMQGLFRNALADPYLLGAASGASLGVTVVLVLVGGLGAGFATGIGGASHFTALVPLAAFVGALGAVLLTVALSRLGSSQGGGEQMVLSGVVVGSVLTSLTTFLMMQGQDRIRAVFSWSMGNLAQAGWLEFGRVWPYTLAGAVVLLVLSRSLDALQLGADTARSLGLRQEQLGLVLVLAASLLTAAAVSAVGLVGFVGLVAPHITRRLVGPLHRHVLPCSALVGAVLLVLADVAARVAVRPAELPVGIVTTALGGPFFLWLLWRRS